MMRKIRRTILPILLKALFNGVDVVRQGRKRAGQTSPLDKKQIDNILIFGTTAFGDTLFGTPAARTIKESFPSTGVAWVAHENTCEILQNNPHIDKIYPYSRRIGRLFKLWKALRRQRYDVVFVFHNTDRLVWALAGLLDAREIIGYSNFNSKQMDFVLTRGLTLEYGKMHAADYYLELVKLIGAETSSRELVLNLSEKEEREAEDFLGQYGIGPEEILIGLQAGAANSYKCWPKEKFAQLANALTDRQECRIVLTGGANDQEIIHYLKQNLQKPPVIAAGRLTIRQTAALINRFSVFVSNDTGPMHLAFCVGTPTVALFCPTDPEATGPYGCADRHVVIKKPRPCEPCLHQSCRNSFCMDQISVEEVQEAVGLLLDRRGKDYANI